MTQPTRRLGTIVRRGKGTYFLRFFTGYDEAGKRLYASETFHGTRKDAEDRLAVMRSDSVRGQYDSRAARRTYMKDLFDLVLIDYHNNGKDKRWADGVIRVRLRPDFDNVLAAKVTSGMIGEYINRCKDAGQPNATINRALAMLRRAFNLGRQCTPQLVFAAPKITLLKENNVRKGFFEDSEYRKLRDALPTEIRPIFIFGYYTGCRRSEILALQWPQVDLQENMVRLDPGTTKNDEARVIPLAGELLGVLTLLKEDRDSRYPECPWVFHRQGQRILDFRGAWEQACKECGLQDETGKPARLFHDLRRTGVRNLIRAGVPEKVAMAISGHKTRSVFDRYNIVIESDLKTAMLQVDQHLNAKRATEQRMGDRLALSEISHTTRTQTRKQPIN
jgi:integrase